MRHHTAYLLAGLLAIGLGGCGDDDATTTPTQGGQSTLTIGVRDYAFDDVPPTITAETPITITNASEVEAHELTAFRLPDDEARDLNELGTLPPDELGALLPGAPDLALVAAPGAPGQLVLGDGSLHEPGRYLLVCFIPIGAKPDDVLAALEEAAANPDAGPPQIGGGPPHLTAGMIAEIRVVP